MAKGLAGVIGLVKGVGWDCDLMHTVYMAKVLLVLENYGELAYCETLLKKVGIDVQAIQNDLSVAELIMTFMPNLVIASAQGRRVNGLRVAGKLLHAPSITPIILLASDVTSITQEDQDNFNISAVIATPIEPQSFLGTVAKLLGLDVASVQKKSERSLSSRTAGDEAGKDKNQWVKSSKPAATDAELSKVTGAAPASGVRFPIGSKTLASEALRFKTEPRGSAARDVTVPTVKVDAESTQAAAEKLSPLQAAAAEKARVDRIFSVDPRLEKAQLNQKGSGVGKNAAVGSANNPVFDARGIAGAGGSGLDASELAKKPSEPRAPQTEKEKRYFDAIQSLPDPTQNGLKRALVNNQIKDFRKAELDPEIQAIDAERAQFTASLYELAQESNPGLLATIKKNREKK